MTMSAEITAGFRQVAADQIAQDIDNNAKFAKVSSLAKVATSGSYNDLKDKPSGGSTSLSRLVSRNRETVLTAGTAFTVPTYTLGGKSLTVTYNGLMLALGTDYTEESATTIKFAFDLAVDDVIVATAYGATDSATRAMQVDTARSAVIAVGQSYQVPTYVLGTESLQVWLNGLKYTDFTEVDATHIAFDIDIPTDMQIIAVVG